MLPSAEKMDASGEPVLVLVPFIPVTLPTPPPATPVSNSLLLLVLPELPSSNDSSSVESPELEDSFITLWDLLRLTLSLESLYKYTKARPSYDLLQTQVGTFNATRYKSIIEFTRTCTLLTCLLPQLRGLVVSGF